MTYDCRRCKHYSEEKVDYGDHREIEIVCLRLKQLGFASDVYLIDAVLNEGECRIMEVKK